MERGVIVEAALFWLAVGTLLTHAVSGLEAALGTRSIRFLRDVPSRSAAGTDEVCRPAGRAVAGGDAVGGSAGRPAPAPRHGRGAPRVSIVVAARNEERNIEEALRSLLRLDYPDYEVIVVDDRSDDRTPEILASLAAAEPRLQPLRIDELPPGWLGKNYALHRGATVASGDLLLFTDADVVMHPSVLWRAVRYLEAPWAGASPVAATRAPSGAATSAPPATATSALPEGPAWRSSRPQRAPGRESGLDHLASTFDIRCSSPLMEAFVGTFSIFFSLYFKPWKAKDPDSRRFIGIGGFNLVRAAVYRAVGGHRPIALRPDDDVKLGKLIKRAGYRQDIVFGKGLIEVEWYASLREAVDGLMKNNFAGLDYRLWAVVAATVAQLVLFVWPWAALFLTSGPTRWLNAAAVAIMAAGWVLAARGSNVRRWTGALFPVTCLLALYILWRSTITTLWRGGIEWRGTFYPLEDLERNRV